MGGGVGLRDGFKWYWCVCVRSFVEIEEQL